MAGGAGHWNIGRFLFSLAVGLANRYQRPHLYLATDQTHACIAALLTSTNHREDMKSVIFVTFSQKSGIDQDDQKT